MPKQIQDEQARHLLDPLRDTPARNTLSAASARRRYLSQVEEISKQGVSLSLIERLKLQRNPLHSAFPRRKERKPMFTTIATILTIVALALGGSGITVAAAQSSLPDDVLYGVKLWSEDAMLWFNNDPAVEWQMALEFAERRAEEVRTMVEKGEVPDQAVQTRLMQQIESTLRLAISLPLEQAVAALSQVQTRLMEKQQSMLQIWVNGSSAEAALVQARETIQNQLRIIQAGVEDPAQLQTQLQDQNRLQTESTGSGQGGSAPWMEATAAVENVTSNPPVQQPANGQQNGSVYSGTTWFITDSTTFQDLLDWGISQTSIESALGIAMPAPTEIIKTYLLSLGLDYSTLRSTLQSLVHQTTMPATPGSGQQGGSGSGGRK